MFSVIHPHLKTKQVGYISGENAFQKRKKAYDVAYVAYLLVKVAPDWVRRLNT